MADTEEVLRWANEVRLLVDIGPPLETLPKGVPKDANSCPLAQVLHTEVLGDEYIHWWEEDGATLIHEETVPKFVLDFIEAFDTGEYPELIA